MNNDQFRRLLVQNGQNASPASNAPAKKDAAVPISLGSRMRSSIPMTPRQVAGYSGSVDFARQLKEANRDSNPPPSKKFKATSAPKGTKLAAGYTDRAANLRDAENKDDVAERIKALEEMVKLGQMEQAAFEKVRDELIGGDIRNVHLVKGLDRKLLERARKGEDVFGEPAKKPEPKEPSPEINVDDELDALESQDVVPTTREKNIDNLAASKKRSRNDILREMKEARQKVEEQAKSAQPALGSRFRKVNEKLEPGTSRLEIDDQGRQVLIVVDMDGNVKRKVKKTKPPPKADQEEASANDNGKAAAPLGADVVIPKRKTPTPEPIVDEDIFADAGTDYNPLAELEDSESGSGEESENEKKKPKATGEMLPPARPIGKKNYFNEKPKTEEKRDDPIHDPEFLAALRKAASVAERLDKSNGLADGLEGDDEEKLKKLARRKEMLATHDRDDEDLDLGFGSSRFDDQEDGEGNAIKLSKWRSTEGDSKEKDHAKDKRKRGPKKKKGDKNSAADVLAVLERRVKT